MRPLSVNTIEVASPFSPMLAMHLMSADAWPAVGKGVYCVTFKIEGRRSAHVQMYLYVQ